MQRQIKLFASNDIFKSSAGLLIITLLAKILGYGEKLLLAYFFGTSFHVDVYTVVVSLVTSIFILYREAIEPGFLNVFLSIKNKGKKEEAWSLFYFVGGIILLTTGLCSLIVYAFPADVMKILAPGFSSHELSAGTKLLKIIFPACIFLALSTLTGITLNGEKKFVVPASGELISKIFIIICLVALYTLYGIEAAALGVLFGAVAKVGVHLIGIINQLPRNIAAPSREHIADMWHLTWPLLIGVVFSQVRDLSDQIFASFLNEGSIASLSYARKISDLPIIILPYTVSVVLFPYFSQLAIEQKSNELSDLFRSTLQWVAVVFIPLSIFFFTFSTLIVQVIFQRGAFDIEATIMTAQPLKVYSIGLPAMAIEAVVVIFYYANANTKIPIFLGIAYSILNVLLAFVLIRYLDYTGIAIAFVISKYLKGITLLFLLKRIIPFNYKEALNYIIKLFLAAVCFTITLWLMLNFLHEQVSADDLITKIFAACFILFGSSSVYIVAIRVLKINLLTKPENMV